MTIRTRVKRFWANIRPLPERSGIVHVRVRDLVYQWVMTLKTFAIRGRAADAVPRFIEFGRSLVFDPKDPRGVPKGISLDKADSRETPRGAVVAGVWEKLLEDHVHEDLDGFEPTGILTCADVKGQVAHSAAEVLRCVSWMIPGGERMHLVTRIVLNSRFRTDLEQFASMEDLPWVTYCLTPANSTELEPMGLDAWFVVGLVKGTFMRFLWKHRLHERVMREYRLTTEELVKDLDRRIVIECNCDPKSALYVVKCTYVVDDRDAWERALR